MPGTYNYPGVYIEEVPSGVRTITGVATSITAFIGRALRGPANEPTRIQSFADYERVFGGLWTSSTMSYAVQHFFLHGGSDALIVRAIHEGDGDATKNATKAAVAVGGLDLVASSEGSWGNNLHAIVDHDSADSSDAKEFNLTIQELDKPAGTTVVAQEIFRNVSTDEDSPRYIKNVLQDSSMLARTGTTIPENKPTEATQDFTGGQNGDPLGENDIIGSSLESARKGLWALDKADLFNLLCIPPLTRTVDTTDAIWTKAGKYCKDNRAMLIIDPPSTSWATISAAVTGVSTVRTAVGNDNATNAILYFPRLKMADPLKENRTEEFAPSGAIAGVISRTDAQRGVWKAPAGLEASLVGVRELSYKMNDGENGQLNPLGLNCLRSFPVYGNVVWGARTLAGADVLASEWKYVPVRRMALFIEESLYRGTQWVVFEPNDEPLWAQIRLNVGAFMQNLFRQGAFQGSSPREAYFVKCDSETTTQNDIDRGIVNILVGFAPLKPAEFVIIKLQQMAGQIEV